jgi:hypothetical protein
MKTSKYIQFEQGFIVASLLVLIAVISILLVTITSTGVANHQSSVMENARLNAQLASDGGLDDAINELNLDSNYTGSVSEIVLLNSSSIRTTYETFVIGVAGTDRKTIRSVGKSYVPSSSTKPISIRTYELDVEPLSISTGIFSVVTGVGGLIMENSAKILDGEVFVNGEIRMQNTAQIGTTTNSVVVKSAHQNCPTSGGASYPTVCSSGQPINISSPARIYGNVCAKNQTNGAQMSNGGLDASCSGASANAPVPQPLPVHNRDQQITNVSTTLNRSYSCSSNNTTPIIWPANYRIRGDVTLSDKCVILIQGDVWIEGKLEIKNTAQLLVSNIVNTGVDGTLATIMVDGSNGILIDNSAGIIPNSTNKGLQLITYYSKASCSPGCLTVTGNDLYSSREIVTIFLKNSASAKESILYARWTQAQLDNGGDIGAIIGQTVKLQNYATITFGARVSGANAEPIFWVKRGYIRTL